MTELFAIRNRDEVERLIDRDAQVRLQRDYTPVDLFFSYHPFHASSASRVREYPYAGITIPVLSPDDVIVHKVLFNRGKDWLDITDIIYSQQRGLDIGYIRHWLLEFFPPDETKAETDETRYDLRIRRFDATVEAVQQRGGP